MSSQPTVATLLVRRTHSPSTCTSRRSNREPGARALAVVGLHRSRSATRPERPDPCLELAVAQRHLHRHIFGARSDPVEHRGDASCRSRGSRRSGSAEPRARRERDRDAVEAWRARHRQRDLVRLRGRVDFNSSSRSRSRRCGGVLALGDGGGPAAARLEGRPPCVTPPTGRPPCTGRLTANWLADGLIRRLNGVDRTVGRCVELVELMIDPVHRAPDLVDHRVSLTLRSPDQRREPVERDGRRKRPRIPRDRRRRETPRGRDRRDPHR